MDRLLIRNGRVIDPASGFDANADIAIAEGRIADIDTDLPRADADQVIDADGLIVSPGLIDPHVHLREPGQEDKETIASGTAAAVDGGFTTVCCMPNTMPTLDSPDVLRFVHDRARQTAKSRVFAVASGTVGRNGERMSEIRLLAQSGAVGISDDGDVIESAGMMRSVLRATAATGLTFMQHCQDPTLTKNASMHAGSVSTRLGLTGWPRIAEEIIIERDVRLVEDTGCRYHVQHLSSGPSTEIIRIARENGLPVSAEASPHHLLLTDQACLGYNTNAKMNPPLREQSDVDAIREAVAAGVITVLATDHAPHTSDEKQKPFAEAPFGIIGLETAVAGYAEALVETDLLSWPKLLKLLTINPARLCNLDRLHRGADGLGELRKGGPADITVIDPEYGWTFTASEVAGKSSNSPFLGRAFRARSVLTVVGGRIAMDRRTARSS